MDYYKHIGKVIAGKYEGKKVVVFADGVPGIVTQENKLKYEKAYFITSKYISSYEIVSQETKKSSFSVYKKSIIGGFIFGGAGAIAGAISAENETTYTVSIFYKDGNKSLLKIDSVILSQIQKHLF